MSVSPLRAAAAAVFGLRIAYGAGLIAAPARLARSWLGPPAQTGPTQIPLQALGMREIVLHTGAMAAAVRGRALGPWLAGSIAGDLTDVVATMLRRSTLPDGAARATLLVGGGSAAVSAALAAALES
jgi:hypothetical protein